MCVCVHVCMHKCVRVPCVCVPCVRVPCVRVPCVCVPCVCVRVYVFAYAHLEMLWRVSATSTTSPPCRGVELWRRDTAPSSHSTRGGGVPGGGGGGVKERDRGGGGGVKEGDRERSRKKSE